MLEVINDTQGYQLDDIFDYFQGAPIGLHTTGPEGKIERANLAELELLGYREHAADYVGRYVAEFHRDPSLASDLLNKVAAGEAVDECEAVLLRRDGKPQRVLLYSNARMEAGKFRGMRCATFPHPEELQPQIAERSASKDHSSDSGSSKAERARLYGELTDFFANAPVGCHIVGGDGLITHANKRELSSMGYEMDAYINTHIATFHADQEVINGMLYNLIHGKPLVNILATVLRENRSKRRVMIYSNSRMRNGSFVNTRCFTVEAPRAPAENEEPPEKFSWPRNEVFETPASMSQASPAKPDSMTLALRYISSRKRPEESLGYLARLSQMLVTNLPLNTSLQSVATLSVPFVADVVSIHGGAVQLAHACTRKLKAMPTEIGGRLLDYLSQSGRRARCLDVESEATDLGTAGADLLSFRIQCLMIVPLVMRERDVGTLILMRVGTGGRTFGPADIALTEEVARRIACAIALSDQKPGQRE
jgi:hypothetical protein